jgi:hypothetical protein
MQCRGLLNLQSSRHCTGRLSSHQASWSLTNTLGMLTYLRPRQLQNTSLPNNCGTQLLLLSPCTSRPRTLCTPLHRGPSSPLCRCNWLNLCYSQASGNSFDSLYTRMLLSTACTFRPRTPSTGLRPAPSSPHRKCRLGCRQASWSLANNLGMLMTLRPRRLLNTCLGNMASIRLLPGSSCTFLPRTLCICLRQAPNSPHCKCRLSSLQETWSLANKGDRSNPLMPQQRLNTCLRCMRCIGLILSTPCICLPRTPHKPLHRP